jgi:hypothetical protein
MARRCPQAYLCRMDAHSATPPIPEDAIRAAILRVASGRRSVCPSEVARALAADWRPLMPLVRRIAAGMAEVAVTQGGVEVDGWEVRGPIRLSLRS